MELGEVYSYYFYLFLVGYSCFEGFGWSCEEGSWSLNNSRILD